MKVIYYIKCFFIYVFEYWPVFVVPLCIAALFGCIYMTYSKMDQAEQQEIQRRQTAVKEYVKSCKGTIQKSINANGELIYTCLAK